MLLCRILLVLSIPLLPLVCDVHAQVDQEHWFPSQFHNNFNSFFGLQQEFTPSLNSMDSAQFSMGQGLMGVRSTFGGPVALNIREGGVGGPVIAVSSTVTIPPMFGGDVAFQFPELVPLVPGQIYAMEPFSPTQATLVFDANRPGFTPS